LNFESNIDKSSRLFTDFERLYKRSNFKQQAGQKFDIYDKKCTKPLTEAVANNDMKLTVAFYSPDTVLPVIEEIHSLLSHTNP
jgi:hypothetical protein